MTNNTITEQFINFNYLECQFDTYKRNYKDLITSVEQLNIEQKSMQDSPKILQISSSAISVTWQQMLDFQ
jgi:hypothetical protein